MLTKEYTWPKDYLPPGPWLTEPDKVQWTDEATGLPCLAVRNHREMGNWCGYVGVAFGHPFWGSHYDNCHVDVHGGLTFTGFCKPGPTECVGICHTPEPGEPKKVWWLGFDCAHLGDLIPGMIKIHKEFLKKHSEFSDYHNDDTYKNLTYVKKECADLARQVKEAKWLPHLRGLVRNLPDKLSYRRYLVRQYFKKPSNPVTK